MDSKLSKQSSFKTNTVLLIKEELKKIRSIRVQNTLNQSQTEFSKYSTRIEYLSTNLTQT